MTQKAMTLKDQFKAIKSRFIELADPKTFEVEVSFALQHIARNKELEKCNTESKLEAVLNVAQIGLSLNPVYKLTYLVPRSIHMGGNKWEKRACLEPSYQGLCKLITDSGSAKSITAYPVFEGDEFDISQGTNPYVEHKRKFKSKTVICFYMVAVLSDGSNIVEVMDLEEIHEIRERSESYKAFKSNKISSCIWVSDFNEMARKTVIRRGIKYLPKTEMWDKIANAINLDEQDYRISDPQMDLIESLLMTAAVDPQEQESIFRELQTMSGYRASEVINYLQDNQLNPITHGGNYQAEDVKKMIKDQTQEQ